MKRLMKYLAMVGALSLLSFVHSQALTADMQDFLRLAILKNGNQKGLVREEVEDILKVSLTNRKKIGSRVSYETVARILNSDDDIPKYKYTVHNNTAIILTYSFTEPVANFIQTIKRIRGYRAFSLPRKQINGLPIYYFEGQDSHDYIPTKKLWIRVYECSAKPNDTCVRTAELVFATNNGI